jgi:hypothetical protein
MKIKILVDTKYGIKKGDIVYVSKTTFLGDKYMFGVKSPKAGVGIIWFSMKEIKEI